MTSSCFRPATTTSALAEHVAVADQNRSDSADGHAKPRWGTTSDAIGVTMRDMEVIDRDPAAWFLLRDGEDLLLDVNCSGGAVGYSWLVRLDAAERSAYHEEGRRAIDRLASAISDSAPAARSGASPYADRDLSRSLGQDVVAAIRRWHRATDRTGE